MDSRPIGVFDSGIGGLTVAGVLSRRLPDESVVYLGDTARVPYGTKSPDVVRRYAERCAAFLMTQNIKALVVACNTASAHALEHLVHTLAVPVFGVINPGAEAALAQSLSGRVGVVATRGTIDSGAYTRALQQEAHRLNRQVEVCVQPAPVLVPLAEEGLENHPATYALVEEYLKPLLDVGVDTVVLGCTHYPVLRPVFEQVARASGKQVAFTDSGEAVTDSVESAFGKLSLAAAKGATPQHRFYLTDTQPRFSELAERFFGQRLQAALHVDL